MKNRTVSIDAADINAKTVQEVTVPIQYSGTDLNGNAWLKTLYPVEIQIINDCGAGVSWNAIIDDNDYADYVAYSGTNHDFIRLPKDAVYEDSGRFYKCQKFLVKGYETSADAPLQIEFINYVEI